MYLDAPVYIWGVQGSTAYSDREALQVPHQPKLTGSLSGSLMGDEGGGGGGTSYEFGEGGR